MNNRIGISLGSHYRLLKTPKDIEKLLSFILDNNLVVEIGFYDKKTYPFFRESYFKLSILNKFKPEKLNLHFPRKDWQLIGFDKVISDIKKLNKKYNFKNFVVHLKDYLKHYEYLKDFDGQILVENDKSYDSKKDYYDVKRWVCDVNHFTNKKELIEFLKKRKDKIKEFHFAYNNHNLFNKKGIKKFKNALAQIRLFVDDSKTDYIFEGTKKMLIR